MYCGNPPLLPAPPVVAPAPQALLQTPSRMRRTSGHLSSSGSCKRLAAEVETLLHFDYRVRSFRNLIFQFNTGRELVLVLPHGLKNFRDRRGTLAPRQIGAASHRVVRLASCPSDAGWRCGRVLYDRGNRTDASTCVVVTAIQVHGVALRLSQHGIPGSDGRLLVGMIGRDHSVLQCGVAEPSEWSRGSLGSSRLICFAPSAAATLKK